MPHKRPGSTPATLRSEYVAGFIDGEGCFTWAKGSPTVSVTNTYLPILRKLQKKYGGSISEKPVPDKRRFRPRFQWRVFGDNAMAVVRDVIPHLIEKKPQAAILLKLRTKKPEDREELIVELKRLKRISYALPIKRK